MIGRWLCRHGSAAMIALLLCAVAASLAGVREARSDERRPLLIEGKKTLYQRVVSRPTADLRPTPERPGRRVPAFTVYYVYDYRTINDKVWLEVGLSTQPPTAGWLLASDAVVWNQSLSVVLNNRSDRERTMFFRDREGLARALKWPESESARLLDAVRRDALPDGSPLIALEPDEYVDINKQFYLLPILGFEDVDDVDGNRMKALRVASMPLDEKAALVPPKPPQQDLMKEFKVGIVFVVDTTLSMDPYIDRTREAIRRVYDLIRGADRSNRFHFGLIGFRSNLQAVPGLEYLTRQFHKLAPDEDPEAFLPAIQNVVASKISTARFYEDSFAGIKAALDLNDWSKFDGKYIILITDASSFEATDPLSSTGYGPESLRSLAQREWLQGAIFALHLLTPPGKADHQRAADQYQVLTDWTGAGSLYYPVAGGSVEAFGEQADRLTRALLREAGIAESKLRASIPLAKPGTVDEKIERQAVIVGNAMRLAYFGRRQGTVVPTMFEAWTADYDLSHRKRKSLDVRVLLTKNQLSDLRDALVLIQESYYSKGGASVDFFNQLRGAAARASRDPRQLGYVQKLGDLIGEYLDGLPYQSPILEMTEDQWQSLGAPDQNQKMNRIKEKLRLYQELNDDTRIWHYFDRSQREGDWVYLMPLDDLP